MTFQYVRKIYFFAHISSVLKWNIKVTQNTRKLEYRTCIDIRLETSDFSDSPVAICLLKFWEEKIGSPLPPPPFDVFCSFFHSSKYFLVNFWLKQPKLVGDFIFMVSLLLLASPVLRRPNPKKNMVLELTILIISPYVHSRVDSNTFTVGNLMPESTLSLCQRVDFFP
jgi:hypothetical protein